MKAWCPFLRCVLFGSLYLPPVAACGLAMVLLSLSYHKCGRHHGQESLRTEFLAGTLAWLSPPRRLVLQGKKWIAPKSHLGGTGERTRPQAWELGRHVAGYASSRLVKCILTSGKMVQLRAQMEHPLCSFPGCSLQGWWEPFREVCPPGEFF